MTKTKFYNFLLILLSVVFLNGCGLGSNNQDSARSSTAQTIHSEDGLFSITIPKGWEQITDYSLNDDADLQAQKRFGDQYCVALIEHKDDLDFTFDEGMEQIIDPFLSALENASISEGEDIVIDGQPAKQYELRGTIDRVKIAYLVTYVNGENYFAQILAWTLASKYKSSLDELKAVTNL